MEEDTADILFKFGSLARRRLSLVYREEILNHSMRKICEFTKGLQVIVSRWEYLKIGLGKKRPEGIARSV